MGDMYTNNCGIRLPRFWKKAFKAAYEDLTSYVMEIIVDMHCAESWVWLRVPFYGEVVVGDSDMVAMREEEPGCGIRLFGFRYCYVCKIGYYNDMLANGFEKIEHDIVEN
ncbi:hypothetical protein JHK87_045231 [Glycine soja]|nr:hypothetical protein JHK87_045231 [Glycine soja]